MTTPSFSSNASSWSCKCWLMMKYQSDIIWRPKGGWLVATVGRSCDNQLNDHVATPCLLPCCCFLYLMLHRAMPLLLHDLILAVYAALCCCHFCRPSPLFICCLDMHFIRHVNKGKIEKGVVGGFHSSCLLAEGFGELLSPRIWAILFL